MIRAVSARKIVRIGGKNEINNEAMFLDVRGDRGGGGLR